MLDVGAWVGITLNNESVLSISADNSVREIPNLSSIKALSFIRDHIALFRCQLCRWNRPNVNVF